MGEMPVYSDANRPKACHRGHPFLPGRMMVGTVICDCATGRRREHRYWQCRVCGDLTFADGHTDDTLIRSHLPAWTAARAIPPLG
jgi:hypothetical protein